MQVLFVHMLLIWWATGNCDIMLFMQIIIEQVLSLPAWSLTSNGINNTHIPILCEVLWLADYTTEIIMVNVLFHYFDNLLYYIH